VAQWFGPSNDFKVTVHTWDCQVGGSYRVQFDTPDGEHICVGEFREIEPHTRLSYTWSWEAQPPMDTLVSFEVEARGDRPSCGYHTPAFQRLTCGITTSKAGWDPWSDSFASWART
jgi:uncharacterized protein YndB with AHSA1/START domain